LTTLRECDNNGKALERNLKTPADAAIPTRFVGPDTSGKIPPGEDGMDLEKDNFEEDN